MPTLNPFYPSQLQKKKQKQKPPGQNDYASGYDHSETEPAEVDFSLMQSDPDAGLEEATWESYPEKDFRGLQMVLRVMFALFNFLFLQTLSAFWFLVPMYMFRWLF